MVLGPTRYAPQPVQSPSLPGAYAATLSVTTTQPIPALEDSRITRLLYPSTHPRAYPLHSIAPLIHYSFTSHHIRSNTSIAPMKPALTRYPFLPNHLLHVRGIEGLAEAACAPETNAVRFVAGGEAGGAGDAALHCRCWCVSSMLSVVLGVERGPPRGGGGERGGHACTLWDGRGGLARAWHLGVELLVCVDCDGCSGAVLCICWALVRCGR